MRELLNHGSALWYSESKPQGIRARIIPVSAVHNFTGCGLGSLFNFNGYRYTLNPIRGLGFSLGFGVVEFAAAQGSSEDGGYGAAAKALTAPLCSVEWLCRQPGMLWIPLSRILRSGGVPLRIPGSGGCSLMIRGSGGFGVRFVD